MFDVPPLVRTYNVSSLFSSTAGGLSSITAITQTAMPSQPSSDISPAACVGLTVLILATVVGNTLVLLALFLDKRLHAPSFFLIANMAIADLLLGVAVLPFSSVLELLNDRWIFGQRFCSTWLALDVLCCTASIIALMAVSIDRYIGVTRPLNYSTIMTTRRTIYLIILVWTVSILTSVVPLFGLTDSAKKIRDGQSTGEPFETCKINKNTFYTIFSSMISFYIPVFILLLLYSRVYKEAKKQGEKLENEKRRLYKIDYKIVWDQVQQQQQNPTNGHAKESRIPSERSDEHPNGDAPPFFNQGHSEGDESSLDRTLTPNERIALKANYADLQTNLDDTLSHSVTSLNPNKNRKGHPIGKRLFSNLKRNSTFHALHLPHYHHAAANDELIIIKRKMHNLKREKKAFRTLGLILGALLICWLPFFVTLPLMSILKHQGMIKDENTENTWFKITFWLGYCNSALNPFVYAFSNRAIRRAFREVICRRCCCWCSACRKLFNQRAARRQRAHSGSLTTETSQIPQRRSSSFSLEALRIRPKISNETDNGVFRGPNGGGPTVSFADFLSGAGDEEVPLNPPTKTTPASGPDA